MKKSNQNLVKLVHDLKQTSLKEKCGVWKRVASDLEKPVKRARVVNLSRINRFSNENDVILVPGKVLAAGNIEKKVTVAAFRFSGEAIRKIQKAGGKTMTIPALVNENPKGKDIKIIG